MSTSADKLAARIALLEQKVKDLNRRPQLGNSSIDDGSLLLTTDGQIRGVIGTQWDGTTGAATVSGPTPPVPSQPTVTATPGGIVVRWDGTFADPQPGFTSPVVAPMDFSRVEVHVANDPTFPNQGTKLLVSTMKGTIESPSGGEVVVKWPTSGAQLYARLVTRSKPGKASSPGLTAGPVASGQVQLGDLGFVIADYSGGTDVYYTTAPSTPTPLHNGAFRVGDLWLQQNATSTGANGAAPSGTPLYTTYRWLGAAWSQLQDQGISASLAQAVQAQVAADSKAKIFNQSTAPTYSGAASSAVWFDTSSGNKRYVWDGTQWVASAIGNGAIQPQSLVASNVIATGSITAALLESVLVLANRVVAGSASGDHSEMDSQGFHVYRNLPGEGLVEVGRLGTGSSNFYGQADSTGKLVASIADDGSASFSTVTVDNLVVAGRDFQANYMDGLAEGVVGYFTGTPSSMVTGIFSRYGVCECAAVLVKGRAYEVTVAWTWESTGAAGDEIRSYVQSTSGTDGNTTTQPPAPNVSTSFVEFVNYHQSVDNLTWTSETDTFIMFPSKTTIYRLMLSFERGAGSQGTATLINRPCQIVIKDLGPKGVTSGGFTAGGGTLNTGGTGAMPTPATTSQQYFISIPPAGGRGAGYWSYRGDGSLRSDTTDVVQGWDPSGFNGDGRGHWRFDIPNITGSVDRVDWYIYTNHTYYNSGGTGIWNLSSGSGVPNPGKLQGDLQVGGYPKPGGKTITLPTGWYGSFKNRTSMTVTAGPSGGTNETYYCRFDGPSARLGIWYTQ